MIVPREVQWFLMPFEDDTLNRVAISNRKTGTGAKGSVAPEPGVILWSPLIWGSRPVPFSLLLDIAAVKTPAHSPHWSLASSALDEAFEILEGSSTQ